MLRRKRPSGFYQPVYLRHDDLCTTEQVKAILEVVMNCVATIHFPIDAFTKLYTNHKWYFHNLGDASEETSVKIFTILKGK